MSEYAVAAIGADRPGIVAAMTAALVDAEVSIEDSSMTILGGHFAMLLLVQGELEETALTGALQPVADEWGLLLEVRPTQAAGEAVRGVEHVIAAYGPDRPGLVSSLAQVLARHAVNVTDFGSRVGGTGSVFAMWFNVVIPPSVDVEALTAELRAAGGEVSLDVTVHPADAEAL